ncbi:MAG TPA: hypothetical protein VKG84_02810 [Candidatus Acidoferrales bacterium]|nr:hypothetical protein [Candidatus Acidoferrales bacterium]
MTQPGIRAVDVLDWDQLCRLAEYIEASRIRRWEQALRVFAYAFTSTADADHQDQLLADLLRNATVHTSIQAAEEVVSRLARDTNSDVISLRAFAKQCGVRLKRG